MQESGKNEFILKKSYEISYALWRIAANIRQKSFARKISKKSVELLGLGADGDYESILKEIAGIEILVKFGIDVAVISLSNGDILLRELNNLKSAITPESGKEECLEIADIFEPQSPMPIDLPPETSSPKAEMRQSAILERIRQIGNCRLSDIQVILPDCSERTIRYDLEALVQRGLIERVGTGGRSVYYRAKGTMGEQVSG